MTQQTRRVSGTRSKWIEVLVVHPDENSGAFIVGALHLQDCYLRVVASSHEARLALLDGIPDVVITDLDVLSGAPASVLARDLRDDPRTSHVALIAITARVEPSEASMSPFDAYLRKPIDVVLLVGLVKQFADVSRAARQASSAG